ncbi:MAG TPA: response regulator receiver protein, partial [Ruminococcaceae bacterium]|nr:response regulator receiver protein [Oscillospiraceae bacterium]
LLIATQNRWQRFDRENQKLRTKMEEVRIVARAKCILVEYLRMSEQQAHRYIEKQ